MREESLCANDNKTYRNLCELTIAKCYNPSNLEFFLTNELYFYIWYILGLAPVSNGPCVKLIAWTVLGTMYYNCFKIFQPPEEVGNGIMGCDIPCEDTYRPVCGTNSQTYSNVCHFENARCKNNSKSKLL